MPVYPPYVYSTDSSLSHSTAHVCAHAQTLHWVCENSLGNSQLFAVQATTTTTNNAKCLTSKKGMIMYLKMLLKF